mgnify:CR=1 FL=1
MPVPEEVLVRIEAAPINPSDLGLLFGAADMSTAKSSTRDGLPVVTANIPPQGMSAMGARIGDALTIGNEGCGIVVRAGTSPEAQALMAETGARVYWQDMAASQMRIETDRAKNAELSAILDK